VFTARYGLGFLMKLSALRLLKVNLDPWVKYGLQCTVIMIVKTAQRHYVKFFCTRFYPGRTKM
jgi:hypothetical protein